MCGSYKFHTFQAKSQSLQALQFCTFFNRLHKCVDISLEVRKTNVFVTAMRNKWELTEEQLQALLLVTTVKLNVPIKRADDEENADETSESTNTSGNKTFTARGKHNKTR